MLALLSLIPAARADCPLALPLADVSQLAATFERAFAERNRERLDTAYGSWTASVPCIREALVRTDIARFHRIEGMVAFLRDDRDGAIAAFAAARQADPAYRLPPGLVGETHPMRKLYDGIPADTPPSNAVLPEPATGWLRLDGELTRDVPGGRPYVFQRFEANGEVVDTAYVRRGARAPVYPLPEAAPPPRRVGVRLAPTGLWLPNPTTTGVYGGLELGLDVWAHANLGVHLDATVALGPDPAGVAVLPGAELGVRVRSAGPLRVWGGAGLLAFLHDEKPLTPGVRGHLGLEGPLGGALGWSVDLGAGVTSGYSEGIQPVGSASVGLVLTP